MAKVTVEFKDPDFTNTLRGAGLTATTVSKLAATALYGEYWTLELELSDDGKVIGGQFLETK